MEGSHIFNYGRIETVVLIMHIHIFYAFIIYFELMKCVFSNVRIFD
jgi:hypothetical protein